MIPYLRIGADCEQPGESFLHQTRQIRSRADSFLNLQVSATIVRTLFSVVGLVLFALLLAENTHAQEIAPRSYLFLEVADASGQRVSDATVRVSGPDGKEILNLKTGKNGTVDTSFPRRQDFHHYDLQITKPGYLPYESVLFPSVLSNR
jgi:hypothetical protein